jgi:four helix bundle protein
MQDFRKLLVWQKAHELALYTYRITNDFPRDEVFGLRNMMWKTSIDIPALIAEGCGRPTGAEFRHSLNSVIALSNRLEYYGIMSLDLKFLPAETAEEFNAKLSEVRMMVSGLGKKVLVS